MLETSLNIGKDLLTNPYGFWLLVIVANYIIWMLTYLFFPERHQWIPSVLGVTALLSTWVYMYMVMIPLFILISFFVIVPLLQYHKR
ncbi:MAG: hypothetical protein DRQ64_01080 [Gammaproteobacteria bacterium]|nr:MAG: hypothetical protein DRQ64_01080 [Gammaproteobacteria bacterium]